MWNEEKKAIINLFEKGFSLDEIQEYMFKKFPDFSCTIKILEEIIQDHKILISAQENDESEPLSHESFYNQQIEDKKNNLQIINDTKPIFTTNSSKRDNIEQLAVQYGLKKASDIFNQ